MSDTQDFNITGLIKSKEVNPGETNGKKWVRYVFTVKPNNSDKDVTMSTFNNDLSEAWNAGDSVNCHYRFDGKYNTLVGFEESDEAPEMIKPGELQEANTMKDEVFVDNKQKVIVRQNVLNRAVELYLAGKIEEKDVLEKAEELEEWVWKE